jgi:hypothetical protein
MIAVGDVTVPPTLMAAEDEGEGEPNPLRPLLIVFLLLAAALDLTFSIIGEIVGEE